MQPEDIDKLFRERLAGHAPTPPAFVWAEIEAEIQPAKRRPIMWLAAAAVALLTLLGGAWWLLSGSSLNPAGRPELAATAPATSATPEKNTVAQATPALAPTSSLPEAAATAPARRPATVVATTASASAARPGGVQPGPGPDRQPSVPALVAASGSPANGLAPVKALALTPTDLPEPALTAVHRPATLPTRVVAFTGPIEVDVRPGAEPEQALAAGPARRGGLLSVLRQARNVVKGDPVDLTATGLPESVTVQARIAGRTLTKTIQL
ncbi:hypothetical protein CDA63_06115 [Hymenobacter amundsenii]|uniref:Uncharacterized protein n=1 Tax=Hymenobacter amundsenii TaxID=2006685 RepID=A0A246FMQ6_9BACT|nr:hypothetical protein [Hymenobacter amundsenii]OWP64037.1 hypothetical protein CDA63_06115 [Hymenobacter amundsenii]